MRYALALVAFALLLTACCATCGCASKACPVPPACAVPAAAAPCPDVYPGEACLPTAPFDAAEKFIDGLFCDMETP